MLAEFAANADALVHDRQPPAQDTGPARADPQAPGGHNPTNH